MKKLIATWRNFFDVRPGEYGRTVFMSLYLLFVLFSYYILKSASEAMFLNKFDIDKLPNLYILMAVFGGGLAVGYSKLAARTSLKVAVFCTMSGSILCLFGMWYPLHAHNETIIYVFAVWVRLFSVVTVTQGWLVASNLFNPREAKRVYGLLGMGMVVGAAAGGEFTTRTVKLIGTSNLLFASAALVALAYVAFLIAVSRPGVSLARVKGGEADEGNFSFKDVATDIGRSRHLQMLVALMTMQFIVDTLIDYQFKAMAKQAYQGNDLTAFLGRFYGRYLNLTEIVLQFFFTTAIVRRIGVGGTLQVMPVSLTAASLFTFASPSVLSASLARLVEASTRYTLSRTGTELFYMPLPKELRNRIKAFIDIFVDRAARGISALMLIAFAKMAIGIRGIAMLTIAVTIPWIILTIRAHRVYVRTIRRRLEARRLDLDAVRVTVEDADTIRLLENTATAQNPRQAAYALSMLNEAAGYQIEPLLSRLSGSDFPEVRAEVYSIALSHHLDSLIPRAQEEIRSGSSPAVVRQATVYLLGVSPDRRRLASELLERDDGAIQEGLIEALARQPELAADSISHEWIGRAAREPEWRRRVLAAKTIAVVGDQGTEALHLLLNDEDPRVAAAACPAAGQLRNRAYILSLAKHLASPRVRGDAILALAGYGPGIAGTLGDMLHDEKLPLPVRANIPRVLRNIPHQRSVDVLMTVHTHPELPVRRAALKALNSLRETAPGLDYTDALITQHILTEAQHYYELHATLAAFRKHREEPRGAVSLLVRTLEERSRQTLERVFRLLGLRYPTREMYWTYLALTGQDKDKRAAAVELLDNVLDQDLKRVLLPMLETPERMLERGTALFGIEMEDEETVLRGLVRSQDGWVVACAMAAAAELKLRDLARDIAEVAVSSTPEIANVARSAEAALG